MSNEDLKTTIDEPSKKSPNTKSSRDLVLVALGVFILLVLIVFSFLNKKDDSDIPSGFQTSTETTKPSAEITGPFSNIDINDDGKEEKVPQQIVESKILLLEKDYKLYAISPVDKKKELILEEVSTYSSSNSNKNIAYIKSCSTTTNRNDCDKNIYIYNYDTGQTRKIASNLNSQQSISWSPDDRYLLVKTGTSSIGLNNIYEVATGNLTNCTFSGDPLWVSNIETLIDFFSKGFAQRPGEISEASGIRKINIETCQSETFISPTDTSDFSKIKIMDGKLVVRRISVNNKEDWVKSSAESSRKISYEKYDLQTRVMETYDSYESEEKQEKARIRTLLSSSLNIKYILMSDKEMATGWELINVYKGGSIFNNEVYLIGPDKVTVKIGENATGTWL